MIVRSWHYSCPPLLRLYLSSKNIHNYRSIFIHFGRMRKQQTVVYDSVFANRFQYDTVDSQELLHHLGLEKKNMSIMGQTTHLNGWVYRISGTIKPYHSRWARLMLCWAPLMASWRSSRWMEAWILQSSSWLLWIVCVLKKTHKKPPKTDLFGGWKLTRFWREF